MSFVYFIREDTSGRIKIGHARLPQRRLAFLQIGHASKLTLLGTVEGGRDRELALHARFASARVRGEWFEPSPELQVFIATEATPVAPRVLRDGAGPLERWLFEHDIRPSHFAKQLRTRPSTVHRLLTGERRPSLDMVVRIDRETQGMVSPQDWSAADETPKASAA